MPTARHRMHDELRRALAMIDADGAQLLSRLNLSIKVRSEMVRAQAAEHAEACRVAREAQGPEPLPLTDEELLKAPSKTALGAALHLRDELEELLPRIEFALVRLFEGEELLALPPKKAAPAALPSPEPTGGGTP